MDQGLTQEGEVGASSDSVHLSHKMALRPLNNISSKIRRIRKDLGLSGGFVGSNQR